MPVGLLERGGVTARMIAPMIDCYLPITQVTRLHGLHGLRAGEASERGDVRVLMQELPKPLSTSPR